MKFENHLLNIYIYIYIFYNYKKRIVYIGSKRKIRSLITINKYH